MTDIDVVVNDGHCSEAINCVFYRTYAAYPYVWGGNTSDSSTGCSGGQQHLYPGNYNGTYPNYTATLDCGLPDVDSYRSALDRFTLQD